MADTVGSCNVHERFTLHLLVFRAGAELIGREPWEIAPDRYRHH